MHGIRALALEHGVRDNSSQQCLRRLVELERLDAELAEDVGEALSFLMQLRLEHGLEQQDAGRPADNLLELEKLSSLERDLLKRRAGRGQEIQGAAAPPLPAGQFLMLTSLLRQWQRRRLRDPAYAAMYQEHPDELVSLDCETTSLDPAAAELLSIGAVKLRGNRILASEALYLLVRPRQAPSADNVRIHGLARWTSARAWRRGRRAAAAGLHRRPPAAGLLPEYDLAVLNRYVRPWLGVPLPQRRIEISGRYYDYKLRQNPDAHIDLSLASICRDLDMPTLPRHDALNDAINAAMLYLALKRRGYG